MIERNNINKVVDSGPSEDSAEGLLLEQNNKKINCKYYDIDSFNNEFTKRHDNLPLIHLNIRSLPKHFDNFQDLLNSLNCRFKIIGLSETRLTSSSCIPHNLELEGYSLTSNRTEASAGGTSIYVCNTLSYKLRNDLSTMLYLSRQLESTFIEISRNGKRNIIVGCIYKHPGMPITHFTDFYLTPLLNKINTEKKIGFLLGDFNIDLLELTITKLESILTA